MNHKKWIFSFRRHFDLRQRYIAGIGWVSVKRNLSETPRFPIKSKVHRVPNMFLCFDFIQGVLRFRQKQEERKSTLIYIGNPNIRFARHNPRTYKGVVNL
jgi:hypothetical protein